MFWVVLLFVLFCVGVGISLYFMQVSTLEATEKSDTDGLLNGAKEAVPKASGAGAGAGAEAHVAKPSPETLDELLATVEAMDKRLLTEAAQFMRAGVEWQSALDDAERMKIEQLSQDLTNDSSITELSNLTPLRVKVQHERGMAAVGDAAHLLRKAFVLGEKEARLNDVKSAVSDLLENVRMQAQMFGIVDGKNCQAHFVRSGAPLVCPPGYATHFVEAVKAEADCGSDAQTLCNRCIGRSQLPDQGVWKPHAVVGEWIVTDGHAVNKIMCDGTAMDIVTLLNLDSALENKLADLLRA